MNKKTYNILTFTIGGIVVLGGKYIGLSLLERIGAFIVIGGLFELIYRKTKKTDK
jgi:predicted benzoate:H+ symporter BenE